MKTITVWSERLTLALLYLSVILAPLAASIVLEKGIQLFLIVASLFCGSAFFYLLLNKDFFPKVKQGIWYALFFGVILVISTVKYGLSIVNHQGITFFTVYQMVILAAYGCMTFAVMSRKKESITVVMGILVCVISVLILSYQNRYMMDLGVLRFLAAYTNPNILGLFSVPAFCACLYLLAVHVPGKLFFCFGAALNVVATLLTGSRTASLALIANCVICVVFSCWSFDKKIGK